MCVCWVLVGAVVFNLRPTSSICIFLLFLQGKAEEGDVYGVIRHPHTDDARVSPPQQKTKTHRPEDRDAQHVGHFAGGEARGVGVGRQRVEGRLLCFVYVCVCVCGSFPCIHTCMCIYDTAVLLTSWNWNCSCCASPDRTTPSIAPR